jgi:signal transduction histidine kinase
VRQGETEVTERVLSGRFKIARLLKSGQGLETLLGTDVSDGSAVVIRMVPWRLLTEGHKARLAYELGALERAAPEGGGHVHGTDGEILYWVRRFIEGATLEEQLRKRPLGPTQSIDLGIILLEQLQRVHPLGVVHRDLKPTNVILPGDGSGPRLVDFGIARHALLSDLDADLSPDAAFYSSPEQAGLLGAPLDGRSDLYSLGVVLYESLTGKPPFAGERIGDVLRQHLTARPPALVDLVPGVPRALDEIVGRLLRKDPRDRYQTAEAALADLRALAAALRAGQQQPVIVVGARDQRRALTEPAFIGRALELATLEEALVAARAGSGALTYVEGESGGGKSWLLEEVGRRALASSVSVLHGFGLDQSAQQPFQVLSGVARELRSAIRRTPAWAADLAARVGDARASIRAALPDLEPALPVGNQRLHQSHRSLGPEAMGEERTLAALTILLDALGTPERPVIILVDDGQWADEATLRLLDRWQTDPAPTAGRYVMVVVTFRSEEVPAGHPLRRHRPTHHVKLRPFEEDDVRRQLASMAGRLPEDAIQTVSRRANGNPFLVSATLHGMVEAGALTPDAEGWRYDPLKLGDLQASDRVANVLSVRLTRLEDEPRRLLTVGALLGRTFDPALAGALAGIEPRRALEIAETWRSRLVWASGSGTEFTFLHDKIREALLAELPENDRRRLHRLAAESLEAAGGERSFELAYHFDAAGDPERALPYALAAAESSRARFALELAERHYRIADRGARAADRLTRHQIAKGLGEVLTLRQNYAEAEERFEEAVALAPDARTRAQAEERWSQLELKQAHLAGACAHAETALRLMGRWVPKGRLFITLWVLWELLVQVLHDRFPRVFVGRRKLEGRKVEDELFAVRVYHSLNGPYFFSKGAEWAAWAHLRHLNLSERYPPCVERAHAYTVHGGVTAGFPGLYERTLRVAQTGYEMCEKLGDVWGMAQALSFRSGTLHFMGGRWAESIEAGKKGSALFERTGDTWEADTGLDFAVTSMLQAGDLKEAVEFAKDIHYRAVRIGDAHGLAWSLDAWTRGTEGKNVPAEVIAAERARTAEHIQTSSIVEMNEGIRLLGHGRPAEALEVLDKATRRYRKEARFFHDLNAPLIVYQATALRQLVGAAGSGSPSERRRLVARWRRAVREALAIGRRFQNNLPHALRESAHLRAHDGKADMARQEIEESILVAQRRLMKYERTLSRLARAELGRELGWADAAADLEAARAEREAILAPVLAPADASASPAAGPVTLSLLDRFATVLEAGRTITTALSTDAILPALRDAALALLRAERCAVVSYPVDNARSVRHGDAGVSVSRDHVELAVSRRQAIVAPVTEPGSALCVPIFVRGAPFACLAATHGAVADLFGDNEKRIGEFLATLAGAALENAEGFSQIQALSRVLEARVAERTAQLAKANEDLTGHLAKLAEAQDQLVQAGKMAAVGRLIAGLSHELNNPLAVILGYVQTILRDSPPDDRLAHPLKAIERQTLRCRHLVHTLLDFSHMKPSLRETVSPDVLFADIIELVNSKARTRRVELRIEPVVQPIAPVLVSPQGIQSVFLNLVTNAIDASAPGTAVVLSARPLARGKETGIEFAVRDSGRGIPADARPHVFDPFFTTKPVGQGTGLGLSLARQIVLDHGGRIELDSIEGAGTTALVWLPTAATVAETVGPGPV